MATLELKVPEVGESITEVEIGDWLKRKGDPVNKDEPVVTLESEKATVELPAPVAGTVTEVLKKKGETAKVGEVIAIIEHNGRQPAPSMRAVSSAQAPKPSPETRVMPAAERVLAERQLRPEDMQPTGPGGRLLKEDVLRHPAEQVGRAVPAAPPPKPSAEPPVARESPTPQPAPAAATTDRPEEVVPMTRLRRTAAERLVHAQQTTALLTTFNEADMSEVIALRKEHGEAFLQKHGVKLGFMSFFVKACVEALKEVPAVNAEVRETDIVYRNYYDIGVAIGGGKGLVVPVLRNAERMSFAEIEVGIADFARRAKESKLKPDELHGGTFTISNGGIYGSLLSTPIVNPPQSGILGMHAIQDRPVAREGHVVIRPMMYLALTYDHRIVDGREAVTFLRRVKEFTENPSRMLLEI
ncbi:MAG: 2-oxoglutarate dehydrogenase complex dihydrolipoyllysine-residue succinyltransferase [Verrucomicrobia subdivision 3 bacterium]|nr:2-oxoglutarate dehydrogenase complex dihydrolipoyllysine-residue succinyltransferase [Limisphaerales bacterium]